MIAIREEIRAIEEGRMRPRGQPAEERARTPRAAVTADEWDASLHARAGGLPGALAARRTSSGPRSARIDNAYGDRNLVCTCPPMESYE